MNRKLLRVDVMSGLVNLQEWVAMVGSSTGSGLMHDVNKHTCNLNTVGSIEVSTMIEVMFEYRTIS